MKRKHGCAGCLTVLAVAAVIGLLIRSSDRPKNNSIPTASAPAPIAIPVNPHEQRLDELRMKRKGLEVSTTIELELGRNLARDALKLSMEPFPDPDERQFLIEKMDEQRRRAAESLEKLKIVDDEIAKEEGQLQPNSDPKSASEPPSQATDISQHVAPPSTTERNQSAPPAEAGKPTSSVLCNGPIELGYYGELTFPNLPGDRLEFTFDHDAWQDTVHREPDGTQTLVMRSIKPGIQTKCDIRWEIAQ